MITTKMHLLIIILLPMLLLTTALPHPPTSKYIGCISQSSTFSPISLPSPFTAPQCLQACAGKATLVAIGGGSCFCDDGSASASFDLVDETRCGMFCIAGDESSGKCGGDGVLSMYQIEGCDGGCAKNGTVPPVVQPSPCTLCGPPSTPAPTVPPPAADQRHAPVPCPPEGCQPAPAPISTPVNNSTVKICPSGGCNANEQGGSQSGNQGSNQGSNQGENQGGSKYGTNQTPNGSSSGGSNAAPRLANESPRLYTSSILSAIAAVIFGLSFL